MLPYSIFWVIIVGERSLQYEFVIYDNIFEEKALSGHPTE